MFLGGCLWNGSNVLAEKRIWLKNLIAHFFSRNKQHIQSKEFHKKVTFDLSGDEDSEGEDMEEIFGGKTPSAVKSESKSSFQKRQEKVKKI